MNCCGVYCATGPEAIFCGRFGIDTTVYMLEKRNHLKGKEKNLDAWHLYGKKKGIFTPEIKTGRTAMLRASCRLASLFSFFRLFLRARLIACCFAASICMTIRIFFFEENSRRYWCTVAEYYATALEAVSMVDFGTDTEYMLGEKKKHSKGKQKKTGSSASLWVKRHLGVPIIIQHPKTIFKRVVERVHEPSDVVGLEIRALVLEGRPVLCEVANILAWVSPSSDGTMEAILMLNT